MSSPTPSIRALFRAPVDNTWDILFHDTPYRLRITVQTLPPNQTQLVQLTYLIVPGGNRLLTITQSPINGEYQMSGNQTLPLPYIQAAHGHVSRSSCTTLIRPLATALSLLVPQA